MNAPKSLRVRLLSRLIVDPERGCLLWTGCINSDGYGQIWVDSRMRSMHRVIWEMFEGAIPAELDIDHLCRVRHCGNVSHMETVTRRENTLRGKGIQAVNARKTHCGAGHPFDDANTYRRNGTRGCRACNREAVRRYKARKEAVA